MTAFIPPQRHPPLLTILVIFMLLMLWLFSTGSAYLHLREFHKPASLHTHTLTPAYTYTSGLTNICMHNSSKGIGLNEICVLAEYINVLVCVNTVEHNYNKHAGTNILVG